MRIVLFSHTSIQRSILIVTALLIIRAGCLATGSRRQLLRHEQYHVTTQQHHSNDKAVHPISGLQIIDDDVNTILEMRELMMMGTMSMSMSIPMSLHLAEGNQADDEIPTESATTTGRYDDNNNEPTSNSSSTISNVGNNDPTPTTANDNNDGYGDLLDQIIGMGKENDKKYYDPEIIPVAGPKPYLFFILVAAVIFIAICLYCV